MFRNSGSSITGLKHGEDTKHGALAAAVAAESRSENGEVSMLQTSMCISADTSHTGPQFVDSPGRLTARGG
jgi:hypothetical protein